MRHPSGLPPKLAYVCERLRRNTILYLECCGRIYGVQINRVNSRVKAARPGLILAQSECARLPYHLFGFYGVWGVSGELPPPPPRKLVQGACFKISALSLPKWTFSRNHRAGIIAGQRHRPISNAGSKNQLSALRSLRYLKSAKYRCRILKKLLIYLRRYASKQVLW